MRLENEADVGEAREGIMEEVKVELVLGLQWEEGTEWHDTCV